MDIAVHDTRRLDLDALGRDHVSGDPADDDHGLGLDLGGDAAVGSDGELVLRELDLALYPTFDLEIFVAAQVTLEHDRLTHSRHFASSRLCRLEEIEGLLEGRVPSSPPPLP